MRELKLSTRKRNKIPTYLKSVKIQKTIDEMNTIVGIELYQDLYKIYTLLFFATENHKLACLNYYIDENEFCAEIKNTWELEIPERLEKHQELLNRIKNNEIKSEEYDNNNKIIADFVDENGNSFETLTLFNQ